MHRGRGGEAHGLADLAHAGRVAALAQAGLDVVEDAALTGGELLVHVAIVHAFASRGQTSVRTGPGSGNSRSALTANDCSWHRTNSRSRTSVPRSGVPDLVFAQQRPAPPDLRPSVTSRSPTCPPPALRSSSGRHAAPRAGRRAARPWCAVGGWWPVASSCSCWPCSCWPCSSGPATSWRTVGVTLPPPPRFVRQPAYVVQPGDTLWSLADAATTGRSLVATYLDRLLDANGGSHLEVGQPLLLP